MKNKIRKKVTSRMGAARAGLAMLCLTMFCTVMISGCGRADEPAAQKETVRIGALKGPTTLGLLSLQEKAKQGEALENYEFQMMTAADEILPLMIKGELDIALIPANVAGVLYQKTNGGIQVININTLGVLYMVSGDTQISEPADLAGRTIYLTGKGTTPDYVLHYILEANQIPEDTYTLEYRAEATEVAAILAEDSSAVGLLPQPFVTAACAQNDALAVVLDMTEEWTKLQGEELQSEAGSQLVTGVTVVRKEFVQEHEDAIRTFMKEHKESAEAIINDVEHGAVLAVEAGIVAKEAIAAKAISQCNITCIDGEEMKQALSGYLKVLFEQDAQSVGSALPEEDFYYMPSDN